MGIVTAAAIVFSPTGNTKKIVDAVLSGIKIDTVNEIDLCDPNLRETVPSLKEDFVIIGCPVYGGFIPSEIEPFLKRLDGRNKPAILITTYGNISAMIAPYQLYCIAAKCGFKVVGVGSFIGEHSYSTSNFFTAAFRPNLNDLAQAEKFGNLAIEKWKSGNDSDLSKFHKEGVLASIVFLGKWCAANAIHIYAKAPFIDSQKCKHCGICAANCPVKAFDSEKMRIIEKKCIHCCRCIKRCPQQAITSDYRFGLPVARLLSIVGRRPKEPRCYL